MLYQIIIRIVIPHNGHKASNIKCGVIIRYEVIVIDNSKDYMFQCNNNSNRQSSNSLMII